MPSAVGDGGEHQSEDEGRQGERLSPFTCRHLKDVLGLRPLARLQTPSQLAKSGAPGTGALAEFVEMLENGVVEASSASEPGAETKRKKKKKKNKQKKQKKYGKSADADAPADADTPGAEQAGAADEPPSKVARVGGLSFDVG